MNNSKKYIKLLAVAVIFISSCNDKDKGKAEEDWTGDYILKQNHYSYWADTVTRDSILTFGYHPGAQPTNMLEIVYTIRKENNALVICRTDSCGRKGYGSVIHRQGDTIDFGKYFYAWAKLSYFLTMKGTKTKGGFAGISRIMTPRGLFSKLPGMYTTGTFQLVKK